MSWDYKILNELGTVSRGRSRHRPRNDNSLFGGKYPFVQTADVKAANFYLTDYTETYNEKDAKSLGNEINDEISGIFKARKQVNLDKVKMPKAVSRTKAKNGVISYDCDSLANRFGALYPEFKEDIKKNIVKYGEFLPETFFTEIGTPKVIDVIKNGNSADQKRLFKMLNEVYEDGTNEVQDVIGVTILGAMQNDKDMMAVAAIAAHSHPSLRRNTIAAQKARVNSGNSEDWRDSE